MTNNALHKDYEGASLITWRAMVGYNDKHVYFEPPITSLAVQEPDEEEYSEHERDHNTGAQTTP